MGCATTTIKIVVFLFNTLCALLGITTIVFSALAFKQTPQDTHLLLILLIVVGSIVFIISFFGCCGAIKENICMTWTYATFMLILFVGNCVLVFVYMRDASYQEILSKEMQNIWNKEVNGTNAMDDVQKNLQCCGVHGSEDYGYANRTIPLSCYQNGNKTNLPYAHGCLEAMVHYLEDNTSALKIFNYVLIGVEGVAFLAACVLAVTFQNQNRRLRY